jgi:undecaprenyl diphosphate synthase
MSQSIKAALLINDQDYDLDTSFHDFNQQENVHLKILQKGQGRKDFLEKVKTLLLSNKEEKEFTQEDIKSLEEELDLVINVSENNSLEDSIVTGINYAEIVFIKKDLKDFSIEDYKAAVEEFKNRKRNFGA